MAGCGAETEANQLYTALLGSEGFTLPNVDFSGPGFQIPSETNNPLFGQITKITNADLTTAQTNGSGIFDTLMKAVKAHLSEEYEKGRITGGDYTKAYIAFVEAAMANGVQFLLGRDRSYWDAVTAQMQARTAEINVVRARIELESTKLQYVLIKYQSLTAKGEFVLTKLKLSTESVNYCLAQYNLSNMLPKQLEVLTNQVDLTKEQMEAQRAQTLDSRSDGTPVSGSVGKQKALYDQQITSYERDAEVKAAKLFTDAWITMKTIDEGLLPPNNFSNVSLDQVLAKLKLNNGLN